MTTPDKLLYQDGGPAEVSSPAARSILSSSTASKSSRNQCPHDSVHSADSSCLISVGGGGGTHLNWNDRADSGRTEEHRQHFGRSDFEAFVRRFPRLRPIFANACGMKNGLGFAIFSTCQKRTPSGSYVRVRISVVNTSPAEVESHCFIRRWTRPAI